MKKLASLLFLVTVISVTLDRELYFYGRNYLNIWSPLPVPVTPQFLGYEYGNLGFVLVDEEEMTVVAPGNMYEQSELMVDSLLDYGFNKTDFYAIVSDSSKKIHLLKINASHDVLNVQVKKFSSKAELPRDINWIQIRDSGYKVSTLGFWRNIGLLTSLLLIVTIAIAYVIRAGKKSKLKV